MWRISRRLTPVALVLAGGIARADESPTAPPLAAAPAPNPAPPPTPDRAADDVLAAVQAKDDARLPALASKDDPDPWIVADELIRRGEHDAAAAFAKAAPRVDVERLPEYVASRRGKPDDPARRARLAAGNAALKGRKHAEALEALGAEEAGPIDDVVGVRLAMARGIAQSGLLRLAAAEGAFRASGDAAERLGWWSRAAAALFESGSSAQHRAGPLAARDAWTRASSIDERRGDVRNSAIVLGNLHHNLGDFEKAVAAYERALARDEAEGDKAGMADCHVSLGTVALRRGDPANALSHFDRALALAEETGARFYAANALNGIGVVHRDLLHDPARAMAAFERLLPLRVALGDEREVAWALTHVGSVHQMRGEHAAAVARFEAALAKAEATGNKAMTGGVLSQLGNAYRDLGDLAKALACAERALALHEATGSEAMTAQALVNLGLSYLSLHDYERARDHFERGLALGRKVGDRPSTVAALNNLGLVYNDGLGEPGKALEMFRQVLEQDEASGDRSAAARTLGNIGMAYSKLGDKRRALATFHEVLKRQEAQGDKVGLAKSHGRLGRAHWELGDLAKARSYYESSRRIAKSMRQRRDLVTALTNLALLYLNAGHSARALGAAGEAVREIDDMTVALSEEQGARVREPHARLFELGTLAAVREDDVGEALHFLESGRAGALVDALGSRDLVRWKAETLSDDLRAADAKAKVAESAARRAYDTALSSAQEDRRAIRAAATALDEARDDVRAVNDRVEREGKRGAGLYHRRPKPLEDVEAALDDGEALILYGLCQGEALAFVVTRTSSRVVSLGARRDVEDACAAFDGADPTVDVVPALATLKRILVDPLALGDDVRRVLVSPEGPLGYLPFGALFDVPVAMTASGTTHVILCGEAHEPGEQVLALGDPDYSGAADGAQKVYFRGRPLSRLPATREEAERIGTTRLLGAAASEDGLRSALPARKRWRAVHFACHGLVDPERPTLSSLALSPGGAQDGFLTALEVLRMDIPSDLVVLSACETAKGKIVGGEGIVGLTRAFMQAGTPRVICSLWKVDDEATKALMVRLYELWNPKDGKPRLPTAEALRKAQEFVKSQEKWKHPYYWAAWVLWGLPS